MAHGACAEGAGGLASRCWAITKDFKEANSAVIAGKVSLCDLADAQIDVSVELGEGGFDLVEA